MMRYMLSEMISPSHISAISHWFCRIGLLFRNEIFGKYGKGVGVRAYELYSSLKYVKLGKYARRLEERPSIKNTFLEVC